MSRTPEASRVGLPEMLERFDRPGPRYTSYPTAVEFHDSIGPSDYEERLAELGRSGDEVAVYVHVPFCAERCTYCACNVVASPFGRRVATPYVERLKAEICRVRERIGRLQPLSQVHFGGGTPTYLTPVELDEVVSSLRSAFDWQDTAEASVEVDPRVTELEHLAVLAAHGFRRLSIGVQDFDPSVQEAIGRIQSEERTRHVVDHARRLGFESVNVDLVYGLPRQTLETVEETLHAAMRLEPDRFAIYSFAYLPAAFGHQRKIDAAELPSAKDKIRLLQQIRSFFLERDFQDIGIDHFARRDDPLAVAQRAGRLRRDFMGYTTRQSEQYIGLGVSAIGMVGGAYFQNEKKLSRYYAALYEGSLPIARGVALDADDTMRADVIADLMCNFAVDKAAFRDKFEQDFDSLFAEDTARLQPLIEDSLVVDAPGALRLTERGRFVARNAAMCFDRYRVGGADGRFSRTM